MMAKEKLFQIGVKALITNSEGKILLLNSGDWHLKHQAQHWDIPGGRIQEGHTVLKTLLREIEEETGIKEVKEPVFFTAAVSNFKDIPIDGHKVGLLLMVYRVKVSKISKIRLSHEHSEYEWVNKEEAAKRLAYKYPPEFTQQLL
jgi:ADP-ribose pyrophosphatase YjhB (NUDIX family)